MTRLHWSRKKAHGLPCFISLRPQTGRDLPHRCCQPSIGFLNTRLNFPFLTSIKQRSLPMHISREEKGHKSIVIWIGSEVVKWNSSGTPFTALWAVLEHGSWTQFCPKPEQRCVPGPHLMWSNCWCHGARLELGWNNPPQNPDSVDVRSSLTTCFALEIYLYWATILANVARAIHPFKALLHCQNSMEGASVH